MEVLKLTVEERLLLAISNQIHQDNGIKTSKTIVKLILEKKRVKYTLREVKDTSIFIINRNYTIQINYTLNKISLVYDYITITM